MTRQRPPFPAVLDSTTMAAFKSCPQKAYLEFMQHWKLRDQSVHLHAGAAYATGIEKARVAYYIDGRSPEDSLAIGLKALLLPVPSRGGQGDPDDSPWR